MTVYIRSTPWISSSIHRECALCSDNKMMWILLFLCHIHSSLSAFSGCLKFFTMVFRCTIQKARYCFCDQLNMAYFLHTNSLNQVQVRRSIPAEIKTLKK